MSWSAATFSRNIDLENTSNNNNNKNSVPKETEICEGARYIYDVIFGPYASLASRKGTNETELAIKR
jgi:hypothetical protein